MFLIGLTVSPFFVFQNSDLFGRVIVLLLIVASIITWTIILDKLFYLRWVRKHTLRYLDTPRKNQTAVDIFLMLDSIEGPIKSILDRALSTIAGVTKTTKDQLIEEMRQPQFGLIITEVDMNLVHASIEESVDSEIEKMEESLGLLGSIVSSCPYIGLLGTVWGVMMAFGGMAIEGKADINAIAPGVSGALLTTVVALIVAIPALIGYNQLIVSVKQLTLRFDHCASEITNLLRSSWILQPREHK